MYRTFVNSTKARMMRLRIFAKNPILLSILPFNNVNYYDKAVNEVAKPLMDDELGWDRVKKIFRANEEGMITRELQSIINITLSGTVVGAIFGGITATKNVVNNFISNNEATRFISHFDAKRHLQQAVSVDFIKKGGRWARNLGLFCFMFSSLTTCITAYRGKLTVGNYILGASVTGLIYKMPLGFRGALVGAGLGGILGGICGSLSISILYLSGVTMDEVLEAQQKWLISRDETMRANIKKCVDAETLELKNLYEETVKAREIPKK